MKPESVEQARQRLQGILDATQEGIFGLDLAGRIVFANPAACRISGYTAEELQGQVQHDLLHAYRRDGSHYPVEACPIHGRMAETDAVQVADDVLWTRDGTPVAVEYALSPMTDQAGSRTGAVVTFREIGAREARLADYAAALERSNRDLDDFAHAASHDLRSPLRGIDQLATWIEEDLGDRLDPDIQRNLELMRGRIARMDRLLTDLLEYSRVGRKAEDLVEVDTGQLVRDVFRLLAPPYEFRLQVQEDMPVLRTLRVPLEQVFRNLISNALKHHDREAGVIEISGGVDGDGYWFTIADDGPGIHPEQHERIFGIFRTLKPRDEVEGSGIGLALVRKVVRTYGGNIQVDSDGQRGTRFHVSWPREDILRRQLESST